MRIIDTNTLRTMFIDLLEDSRYALTNDNYNDVNDIHFGTNTDEHDHIYTEYGYYNEAIQNVPDTEETLITPGIFAYDGADIVNNPKYDCYNVQVAFEFLAFERQREAMRRLLEKYASDIRGKHIDIYYYNDTWYYSDISDDVKTNGTHYTAVISVEMPVFSETINQSGYDRFQAYINIDFTVLTGIELGGSTSFSIDGETLPYSSIKISREKTTKAYNVKSKETMSYAENQVLKIAVSGMLANTTVCNKIKAAILGSSSLNATFTITYDTYTYTMYMVNGSIDDNINETLLYTAVFAISKEV